MVTARPATTVGRELIPARLPSVSVYVHIPFCSSRCNYCDFYFETTHSPGVIDATLDRILEEAGYFSDAMGRPRVRSLYFGGGTPSIVPPALLDRFLARLREHLPAIAGSAAGGDVECTFEANPESVTPELLDVLVRNGVNRISLGVQSFHDSLLRTLTRRADRSAVLAALETIGRTRDRVGKLQLNVDLITGIPGQSRAMIHADIETALSFGADHFSIYSLTVEKHTPLRQALDSGVRRMPPPELQDDLWLDAQRKVREVGFEWYEVSNFARTGKRSEHNLCYWRLEPYLGLGPGGVSTIPLVPSEGGAPLVARLTNPNLFVYGSRLDRSWHHEIEPLPPRALLFEHFITGLRTSDGVSLERLEGIFGVDIGERWREHLERWIAQGVVEPAALALSRPGSGRGDPPDLGRRRLLLTESARLTLDRHLLEIDEWIDELGELPPPRWPPSAM